MEPGFLSRSRSDDTEDTLTSRRTNSSSVGSTTPVKVVIRLRPLRPGERKQAVFPDWSSAVDEPDSLEEEETSLQSGYNNNHQSTNPSSPLRTPQRSNHQQQQNDGSGILPPSASRIPTLSRSRWNRPNTKGVPSSLIVESSHLSPGPSHSQARVFKYDAVLTEEVSQAKVYQQTVGNAIRRNLFRGFNTTICAYGQTGSGKTFTMQGPHQKEDEDFDATIDSCTEDGSTSFLEDDEDRETIREDDGIMPRALKDVFDAIAEFSENEVTLEMTYMEIYRDELRDLLVDRSHLPLQLYDHHHEQGHVVVHGLRSVPVYSLSQAYRMIRIAQRRRTSSRTPNHVSSRSHAICTLHVTLKPASYTNPPSPAAAVVASARPSSSPKQGLCAKLTLVDLAGSERLMHTPTANRSKTHSDAITINKDLFVLGKVVAALASPPVGHVPYRDSKLTRILRDSLGGNCCTVFIACVSTAEIHLEESLHTLRYAARAQSISHTVRRNVLQSPLSAHDASFLRAENQRLKARLDQYEVGVQMAEFSSLQSKLFKAEQEAQRAREHAKSVRRTADKWKEQFEKIKVARAKMNLWRTSSVTASEEGKEESPNQNRQIREIPKPKPSRLTVETSLHDDMDDDLDVLLGDDPDDKVSNLDNVLGDDSQLEKVSPQKSHESLDNLLGDDSEVKNRLAQDSQVLSAGFAEITQDMKDLSDEKVKLAEQVAELNQVLAEQRSKMLTLEEDYTFRQSEMTAHIAKQEKQRDQLDEEVERLKQKVHLLSSDLKQEGASSMAEVFRSKNDALDTQSRNEVEMQTWRMEATAVPNAAAGQDVAELKKELSVKETECRDLQEHIDRLTAENLALHDENDKLRAVLQHGKENQSRAQKFSADVSIGSGPPTVATAENDLFISNLNDMMKQGVCIYELSPLTTNSTQIDFYLPKLKVFCPCGKHSVAEDTADFDPTALTSILRPWQLEFLESCGITHTIHLLQAARHRASDVAKKMRKWRRKKKLPTFHTPSCAVAVHIWSRTCIRVLKSVHQQKAHGRSKPVMPDFMEYKLDPDLYTVSSIGQLSHRTGTVSEDDGTKTSNRVLFGVPE